MKGQVRGQFRGRFFSALTPAYSAGDTNTHTDFARFRGVSR
jgi:hypothetical protein